MLNENAFVWWVTLFKFRLSNYKYNFFEIFFLKRSLLSFVLRGIFSNFSSQALIEKVIIHKAKFPFII